MKKLRLKYILLIILGLAVLIFIFTSIKKSPQLTTILESPVAHMQLTTAQVVNKYYKDKEEAGFFPFHIKPHAAEMRISYKPLEGKTKDDVFKEITSILEINNVTRVDTESQSGYYWGTLKTNKHYLLTSVQVYNHSVSETINITITAVSAPRSE